MFNICLRYLFLSFALLFSLSSNAEDYYWKQNTSSVKHPSALAAAQYVVDQRKLSSPSQTNHRIGSTRWQGAAQFQFCILYSTSPTNHENNCWNSVYRYGNGCPVDSVYNTTTGSCDSAALDGSVCSDESVPPPRVNQGGVCVSLNSSLPQTQCKYYAGTGGVRQFWMYETSGGPPKAEVMQNKDGCEVSTAEGFKPESDCKYFPPTPAVPYFSEGVLVPGVSQPGAYKCKASTVLTGNYTPPATGSGQKPSDTICADPGSPACTLKDLEKKKEQKPCTYTTDSQGNQVCVSSKFEASEGKTKCGFVGSEFKCSEDLNKAVGEGISIATKVETKPQPDGKTKVTKTDVQTATSCKGIICTTKTTTTTTTTIKDGTGVTESVSGTCTGDNCPDKNGNPDGDGDGFGDCTGDDCGEVSGQALQTPELQDVDGYQETTQKFYGRAKSSPLLSAVSDINAPTAGVAPNFQSDPIQALGGARADFGIIGQLVPNIDFLALVMKAVWCFIAVVVFLLA